MGAWLWMLFLGPVVLSNEVSGRHVRYTGRVVNGEDANIADFPFYGALAPKRSMFMDLGKTHLAISCGSSLISPRFFITAYHCFLKHSDPMYWVVIMGIRDRCHYDGKGRVLEVSWIYKHPQANVAANVKMNDLALMLVSKPVTDVTPLALPLEPPQLNEKGYIIGFGLSKITSPQGDVKDMACRPQKALQYVPDQKTCIKPKETIVGAFCIKDVSNRQAAACRGDSGGPYLVLRNGKRTLLGLSSFGDKLCKPLSNSDHFTNVHNYVEWINKMLHEPLPEGYKRMQEHIHQFEPVGMRADDSVHEPGNGYLTRMNGSHVLHTVANGRVNVNGNLVMPMSRYANRHVQMAPRAPQMYYRQPSMSVDAPEGSGFSLDPSVGQQSLPVGFSLTMNGETHEPNLGQRFQAQYGQQASGHDASNFVTMVNQASSQANPNMVAMSWHANSQSNLIPLDPRLPFTSFNNFAQQGMMPQSLNGGNSQAVDDGFELNNLSELSGYDLSQSGAEPYTQSEINYPGHPEIFFGYK